MRAGWAARFPDGWWGYHWAPPRPMSAVEIIGSGSVDARLMATLWAVMARRGSVMLASEAPMAGKTTTLSALVDFLPAGTTAVFLRGWWEDFGWLDRYGPDDSYVLVNEMSDHLPIYVWGRNALRALELAGRGHGLGATMHADSLPEAIESLQAHLRAADRDLAGLTLYLQFSAYRTPGGMYRRVEEAWHLRLAEDGGLAPVRLAVLGGGRSPRMTGAQRYPVPPTLASDGGRRRMPLEHNPEGYAALAGSLQVEARAFEAELKERATFLLALAERGICEPEDVRVAVAGYPNLPITEPAPRLEGADA